MPLTAGEIVALALEASHSRGKHQQAKLFLNSVLAEVCQEFDIAEARTQFLFHFQPGAVPPFALGGDQGAGSSSDLWNAMRWNVGQWGGNPQLLSDVWNQMAWNVGQWGPIEPVTPPGGPPQPSAYPRQFWPGNRFGSGPYLLPVDYLRLSGSSGSSGSQRSFIWWLDGVPYPIIPFDLAEFDLQVQQAGLESFVWLSATDMSAPLDDRILLTTTGDVVLGSDHVENLGSTTRLLGGDVLGIAGQGIVPGTMIREVFPESSSLTLSLPAQVSIAGASLIMGYCPVVFVYPPPQTPLQAMIRYQRRMPDIHDLTRYPWFHDERYLRRTLIGALCELNDDDRAAVLLGGAEVPGSPKNDLRLWLMAKDDEPSHPKRVELDRRRFGRGWAGAGIRVTKRVGW